MNVTKNVLSKELKYFREIKKQLLANHSGQFVLIKDNELVGVFTTQEEAYKKGVEKFDNNPFLIHQVIEEEQRVSIPALTIGVMNARLQ